MSELNKDIFTVSIPWGIDPSIQINELELPIVLLQQNIIDSLQEENAALKEKCKRAEDGSDWKEQYLAAREKNAELVANFDRAVEATEVVRRDRARYIDKLEQSNTALNQVTKELGSLKQEHASALRTMDQQQAEIAGFPRLTENKIKAALAAAPKLTEDTERLKAELAKTKEKNVNLNDKINALTIKANAVSSLSELIVKITKDLRELGDAYRKSDAVHRKEISAAISYISYLTTEHEQMKANAYHLSEVSKLNGMRTIYESGPWQVVLFSGAEVMAESGGKLKDDQMPILGTGVTMAINQETGVGHFAYVNVKGELTFSNAIDSDLLVPESMREGIKDAIVKMDLKSLSDALTEVRVQNNAVSDVLVYLNEEWSKYRDSELFIESMLKTIDPVKLQKMGRKKFAIESLIPVLKGDIERINEVFGCDLPVPETGEILPVSRPKKASKSKRKKRR